MKILKHILVLGVMLLVCICTLHITTAHAEPETTAAVTEVTTQSTIETTSAAAEDTEVTHTYQGYIIVLLSALFGCLVALGFWINLGA